MTSIADYLRDSLADLHETGAVEFLESDDPIFEGITAAFPTEGGRVDWTRCPRRRRETRNDDPENAEALLFAEEKIAEAEIGPEELALVAGDGGFEIAVEAPVGLLRDVLPPFLDTPQHVYVVGSDYRWCLAFTMIGEMNFAFAPRRANGPEATEPEWDGAEVAMERLEEKRPGGGFQRGDTVYVHREAAADFLDVCQEHRMLVLGIELFNLAESGARPDESWVADYSALRPRWEARRALREARRFVAEAPESSLPQAFAFELVFRNPRRR